ncbi:hypothetical protein BDV06DRAFT_182617 [Aspergillus oleicola]
MIYDFDLYNHPESSTDVKNQLKIPNEQLKIVEGLQHARSRLTATRSLESNTLSKCNVFVHYVNNSAPGSNFNLEVRTPSSDPSRPMVPHQLQTPSFQGRSGSTSHTKCKQTAIKGIRNLRNLFSDRIL